MAPTDCARPFPLFCERGSAWLDSRCSVGAPGRARETGEHGRPGRSPRAWAVGPTRGFMATAGPAPWAQLRPLPAKRWSRRPSGAGKEPGREAGPGLEPRGRGCGAARPGAGGVRGSEAASPVSPAGPRPRAGPWLAPSVAAGGARASLLPARPLRVLAAPGAGAPSLVPDLGPGRWRLETEAGASESRVLAPRRARGIRARVGVVGVPVRKGALPPGEAARAGRAREAGTGQRRGRPGPVLRF